VLVRTRNSSRIFQNFLSLSHRVLCLPTAEASKCEFGTGKVLSEFYLSMQCNSEKVKIRKEWKV